MRRVLTLITLLGIGVTLPILTNAQAYFGGSFMSADYSQNGIVIDTFDENDPRVTGTRFFPNSTVPNIIFRIEQKGGGERPERNRDLDLNLDLFTLKYGYAFSSFFSLELRGGFGVGSSELKDYTEETETSTATVAGVQNFVTFTTPVDSELRAEYFYGGYMRIGGGFKRYRVAPYLLVGHSRLNFAVNDTGGTAGGKRRGRSYGAGLNIRLYESTYFNIEYLELIDKGGIEVKNWSGGFEYRL